MPDDSIDLDAIRADAAAEERAAVVAIIEAHMRQLSHGHGATGAQVLQHILEVVLQREADSRRRPSDA
jgi:hypothetical protein